MSTSNTVFVGAKPLRVYTDITLGVLEKSGQVTIAARGSLISKAIVVALRVQKEAKAELTHASVSMSTMKGEDGKDRDVPSMEIKLTLSK
jgi:DNA-binding protein Alba